MGGTVSGLPDNRQVGLINNSLDVVTVSKNGTFVFSTSLTSGSSYSVRFNPDSTADCTVVNGAGSVGSDNVSNVSVTCVPIRNAVRVTVYGLSDVTGLVIDNNGGDDELVLSSSGAHPFSKEILGALPYSVRITSQPPSGDCTLDGGASGVVPLRTGATVDIKVICPWHAAYLANYNSTAIEEYFIDQRTGAWVTGGAGGIVGLSTVAVAASPNGRNAYGVAFSDSLSNFSGFSVDQTTGLLRNISGPVIAGSKATSLALSPDGKRVYVTSSADNRLLSYDLDPTTKAPRPSMVASYATGANPYAVAVHPYSRLVYVANRADAAVSGYSVDAISAALTPIPGAAALVGSNPRALAIDPTGRFLYVVSNDAGSVSSFAIDPATGSLTAIGSPVMSGGAPTALAIDGRGRFVYVTNSADNSLTAFSIDRSTGSLTKIVGSPFATGTYPGGIAVDPENRYLYVSNLSPSAQLDASISTFIIDAATGALTAAIGSPTPTPGRSGFSIAVAALRCTPQTVTLQLQGDSTQLAQYNLGGVAGATSLQALLEARFGTGAVTVTTMAVSGSTSNEWTGSVAGQIALFDWGINDQLFGTSLVQYRANLARFADASATVILETPNPITSPPSNPAYAQSVREVAASTGAQLADVDRYVRSIPGWESMLSDGVHPTAALYGAIARDVLLPAVTPVISRLRCE